MNFILEKSKLWVVINLGQDEDEQKIFDSINSTGVKLTATDIIKNTLFDKAIKLQTNYETLYKDYWENVFEGEKKEKMAFFSVSDDTGKINAILFPNQYKLYSNLKRGSVIRLYGKVEKRVSEYQLIANKIEIL